jgi:hypothetical protein
MATTVDEILVRFLGDTTDFDRARTRFARGLQQIGRAGTMAGAAVTAGFGAIVGGSAAAAASLEQTTIAYDVLVGNIEKSRKLLRDMEQFAKISPFDVGEVEMAGKRLMAMGFAAKDIIPTLKDVGDVTAGIGIGGGRFERIIHNLAQVKTQGKLTARELRDFAVNGVPLLDALATSIEGLSPNLMEARAQIHDMIRRGQISDMQVLRAFRRMASEGGKFADLMFKQSKTFLGMLSNIRDSLLITAREIGQVFLPTLKSVASTVLDLLDLFRSMDPAVKRVVAVIAVMGVAAGTALTGMAMAAMALGVAMLFLGPAIKMFTTFTALLLSSKIVFAGIASIFGTMATSFLTLINPLSLVIVPVMLIAKAFAFMVTPLGLILVGMAGLAAAVIKTKNSFGGWTKLFTTIKDAAFNFAKNVVGFFWNIQENSKIILNWLSKNWRTVFKDIATFLVESLKLAGPVVVQNFLVVSKAILRMTAILFDSISTMALNTWKYIWSKAFIDAAKRALIDVTVKYVIPFFIALRRAWDSWKFDPLEEWADAAEGTGGPLQRIEHEWEEMWKNMKAITLAELKFDGPDLNFDLDGLFKGIEDWKPTMNDLFEKPKNDVKEINELLFKMSHYFGDKDFHISQQGLDFGIQKAGMTPGVLNPEVDTAEHIGGGGIPMAGDKPMMGAFAGVPSMSDILAMPDVYNPLPDFDSYGTGALIMEPNTDLENLIDDTMSSAQEGATTVLNTVDEAISTAESWFDTTMDWVGQTMTESERHAPMTPIDRSYDGGQADWQTFDFVQRLINDTMASIPSDEYNQTFGANYAGGINAPFPSGPLEGMTQSVGDRGYPDFIPQSIIDQAYDEFAGASPGGDPNLIDTKHELELLDKALGERIKKYIQDHQEEFLEHIAPPPGTNSYTDEKFYGITPGSVGPGPEYNPGNTGYVPGVTGGQFATYGPFTPQVIGGPAPNTYGGVPGFNSTLEADLGTLAGNTILSSILPSWLSPAAVNTLNPANATINAQPVPGQQQEDSGVLDRLDTLIDVTETNGPTAPNQVDELGIK